MSEGFVIFAKEKGIVKQGCQGQEENLFLMGTRMMRGETADGGLVDA